MRFLKFGVALALAVVAGFAMDSLDRHASPNTQCGFLLPSALASPSKAAPKPAARPKKVAKPAPDARRKVIATYFHGNVRCVSCRKIEAWTAETIRTGFRKDIQAGRLEWRVVNVDVKGNEHYAKEYQLYTKSVILSDVKGGKETRWKNLGLVWSYMGDEARFKSYVRDEVAAYLKGA
jgi:hypothetical protein